MLIAGEWTDAEDGSTSDVLNPATGEVIATTPKATISDVERCVAASRANPQCKGLGGNGSGNTTRSYPSENGSSNLCKCEESRNRILQ